jgi:putative phosphoribosyl transferase
MFASRQDAGRKLGEFLRGRQVQADIVLGLPRGGVIVAAEVAAALHLPLDVLLVRKLGHPAFREFAVGALAEEGVILLDEQSVSRSGAQPAGLDQVLSEETARLREYEHRFHLHEAPDLTRRAVLLVDDGLATGATTEAAVLSAQRRKARSVIVTAPVGSFNAVERLERVADQVLVLEVDPEFDAVGRYYETFEQTSDEEVLAVLRAAA